MKRFIIGLCCILLSLFTNAQEKYSVNGESLVLKTEIEGNLDLLWNIIDGEYRYFLKYEDNSVIELKNTKSNGKFQFEYRDILRSIDSTNNEVINKIDFTLYELGLFVDSYNKTKDSNYISQIKEVNIQVRLEGFIGITNSPFVRNPENVANPQVGFSIELIDLQSFPRHALYFNGRHVFKNDDFNYSVTELALGYRFRIINTSSFSLYTDLTFGTLSFLNTTVFIEDDEQNLIEEKVDEIDFDAPLKFGIGADYRITPNSFITLGYSELFAIILENKGNFSTNISLGYKVNL